MKPKKSWREKLTDSKGLPRVGPIEGRMTQRWGQGTMVIPAPTEVDAIMKTVPRCEMHQEKLIVFVRAPRRGPAKTRLARTIGPEAACAAYQGLVLTLLRQLQPLPALELCFSPDDASSEVHAWLREGWERL